MISTLGVDQGLGFGIVFGAHYGSSNLSNGMGFLARKSLVTVSTSIPFPIGAMGLLACKWIPLVRLYSVWQSCYIVAWRTGGEPEQRSIYT